MKGERGLFVLKKEAISGEKGQAVTEKGGVTHKKIRLPLIALGGIEENLGMVGAISSGNDHGLCCVRVLGAAVVTESLTDSQT